MPKQPEFWTVSQGGVPGSSSGQDSCPWSLTAAFWGPGPWREPGQLGAPREDTWEVMLTQDTRESFLLVLSSSQFSQEHDRRSEHGSSALRIRAIRNWRAHDCHCLPALWLCVYSPSFSKMIKQRNLSAARALCSTCAVSVPM